jgi:hypothetical protein
MATSYIQPGILRRHLLYLCQNQKPSSERARRRGKANRLQPRRANSCGKKWSTSVRENMGRVRLNKPSRLVCPRRVGPVSSCRRRKKERPHDERENRRSATSPRVAAEASDLPPSVLALLRTRLNGKAVPRHHTGHSPGKRIRPRSAGALPIDPAPLKKLPERGNEIVRRCPRRKLTGKKGGRNGNTQTTFCARKNIRNAAKAAKKKRTISHLSKKTRTALGKEGAKAARKKRAGKRR